MPAQVRRTQQSRREETVAKLIDAAEACFVEVGFSQAGVQMICDRAGMSQGALFRHFKTKNDLVAALALKLVDELFETAQASLGTTRNSDEAVAILAELLCYSNKQAVLFEIFLAMRYSEELRTRLDGIGLAYRDRFLALMDILMPGVMDDEQGQGLAYSLISLFHGMAFFHFSAGSDWRAPADPIRIAWVSQLIREQLSRGKQG